MIPLTNPIINIDSKSSYMDFRNETDFDGIIWHAFDVKTDENTRIRVYCTQLMEEVIQNIESKNDVIYHASLWYKIGDNLALRFPHRSNELIDASFTFWERVQSKIKNSNSNNQ